MKLATYQDDSRDGQLVVVSQNLRQAHYASHIASSMRQLLDDWNFIVPQLEQLYQQLNHGNTTHAFEFDATKCMVPLPRPADYFYSNAYRRILENQAKPQVINASASSFAPSHSTVASWLLQKNADFTAGLACITADIEQGADKETTAESVRLLMLNTHIILRPSTNSIDPTDTVEPFTAHLPTQQEEASLQNLAMTLFSPVAITPDELQDAWQKSKVHLRIDVFQNNQPIARCPTGDSKAFSFAQLLAHAAQTHTIASGSILSTGAVLHGDEAKGHTSILLKRLREQQDTAQASTPYLQPADQLKVEMKGNDGHSLFGSIIVSAQVASALPTASKEIESSPAENHSE